MSGGYELHQKLRTKAVRQIKKKDYDGAIQSLFEGSKQLLQANEQGSGCDLACYLVDVYQQAKSPSTEENRSRITTLISLSAPDFWRKKVIDAAIKWSITITETPAGDGNLRLAIAEILSKGEEFYASEPHYIAACSPPPGLASHQLFPPHAPKSFACMMLDWLTHFSQETVKKHGSGKVEAVESLMSGSFSLRGLIPLLLARSMTSSRAFLSIYISQLVQRNPSIMSAEKPNPKPFSAPVGLPKPSGDTQMIYSTINPELNFAQAALSLANVAVEHKKQTQGSRVPDKLRESWAFAIQQFEKSYDEDDFINQSLPDISKIYFDVQTPRNPSSNFMQDMLGSLMGGGPSSSDKNATIIVRHAPPPVIPEILQEDSTQTAPGDEDLDLD